MFQKLISSIAKAFGQTWVLIITIVAVCKHRVSIAYYTVGALVLTATVLPGSAVASVRVIGAITERCGTADAFKPTVERIAGEFMGLRVFAIPLAVIIGVCLGFAIKSRGARGSLVGTLAGLLFVALFIGGVPTAAQAWVNSKCE
jgi:hypothetical protein